jgi:hypothetical protein
VAKGSGIKLIRTAVRAPLMNSVCERFLGSVRRECLDHIIILGERHLKHVVDEYSFQCFNTARPHQGLGQRIPVPTPRPVCSDASRVHSVPVLGGLHPSSAGEIRAELRSRAFKLRSTRPLP